MTFPFTDQSQRDYLHEQDAAERAAHLKLVHSAAAGGDEAADAEVQRLAVDFADTTDACNFILSRYAQTSKKFYDPSKRVRDFLCAVIGATGGKAEYVEVTDEDLAARMGCSTKTVQNARNEFRSWPDHAKILGVKDNYREPLELGGKSHPHSYFCRLTLMSAAATADARLGVDVREAARVEADSVEGFVNRAPKHRKKATDSQMVVRELKHAAETLRKATARKPLARHVDLQELAELRRQLVDSLAAFDEAYGFHAGISTQNTNTDTVETRECEKPVEPADERRVETSVGEVESPQVENFSTHSDLTESTTYDFDESGSEPEYDLSEYVWIENGEVCNKLPPPGNDELDAAIFREVERLKGGLAWAKLEGRLGKEGADATG